MIDFMNESKLMDLLNSSEYVPSYEDKDGDWMLVGDVPWQYVLTTHPIISLYYYYYYYSYIYLRNLIIILNF